MKLSASLKTLRGRAARLWSAAAAWAAPTIAWAQTPASGVAGEYTSFLHKIITVGQQIGGALIVLGFIRVGMMFADEDKSDQAIPAAKRTMIGAVFIATAATLAQWIKSHFTAGRLG